MSPISLRVFIVEAFYSVVIYIELIRPLDPNWPIKLSKEGKKQLVTFKKVQTAKKVNLVVYVNKYIQSVDQDRLAGYEIHALAQRQL